MPIKKNIEINLNLIWISQDHKRSYLFQDS